MIPILAQALDDIPPEALWLLGVLVTIYGLFLLIWPIAIYSLGSQILKEMKRHGQTLTTLNFRIKASMDALEKIECRTPKPKKVEE